MVVLPHRMLDSVETTALRIRLPSTWMPLALSRSMIMMSVSVTTRRACSRESSGSGITMRVPLRPMV
jgi:hypothetical protein